MVHGAIQYWTRVIRTELAMFDYVRYTATVSYDYVRYTATVSYDYVRYTATVSYDSRATYFAKVNNAVCFQRRNRAAPIQWSKIAGGTKLRLSKHTSKEVMDVVCSRPAVCRHCWGEGARRNLCSTLGKYRFDKNNHKTFHVARRSSRKSQYL